MDEQKKPQNTPIGLTDDELDQVSGGILYKVKPGVIPHRILLFEYAFIHVQTLKLLKRLT